MQVVSIPAATVVLINKEIEASAQAIFFDLTLAASNTADETMANIKAIMTAVCGTATVTLTRQVDGNSEVVWPTIGLKDLLEMSTNNDLQVRVDNDDTTLRVRCTVPISNNGAVNGQGDGTKLILGIAAKVSAAVYDIYALDLPTTAGDVLIYKPQFANAATEKTIPTNNSCVVAWPIDVTTSVTMYFNLSPGMPARSVTLTVEELKQRLWDSGSQLVSCNGRDYKGYMNLALLNVEACWQIKVTLSSSSTIYLIQRLA